jgi:hypothetical protein
MKRGLNRKAMKAKLGSLQQATPGIDWIARQELGGPEGWTLIAKDRQTGEVRHTADDLRPVSFARYIDALLAGVNLARESR